MDSTRRRAFSLTEIMIAATILAIVGVPTIGVLIGSKDAISRTDAARDNRYFVREILAHAERMSLHTLWDEFGPGEVVPEAGRMKHEVALYDPATGKLLGPPGTANPLGFAESFLRDMARAGVKARLYFEFYTRRDLEVQPLVPDPRQQDIASARYGLLHMQAGYATVRMLDLATLARTRDEESSIATEWQQPIMCPAVVGRPGLALASCPAVNRTVRRKYLPLLLRREAIP
jgi:prepilin-type N-terminal cleavage/methylation domain-containing protein